MKYALIIHIIMKNGTNRLVRSVTIDSSASPTLSIPVKLIIQKTRKPDDPNLGWNSSVALRTGMESNIALSGEVNLEGKAEERVEEGDEEIGNDHGADANQDEAACCEFPF